MRKYETIPHPFVIEPPEEDKTSYAPGDELVFTLVLIGKAIESVPYFICAFEQMAEQGLGSGRARFKVAAVRQGDVPFYDPTTETITAPAATQTLNLAPTSETATNVTFIFTTPTHIVYQGRVARRPAFHVVFRSLLRRLGLLAYFHDQPVEINYQGLIKQAEAVKTDSITTGTTQWRRFSTRQNRAIRMDGIMGKATYTGDLKPFLPYLRAGEVLHVGKSTAFGMGKYQLEVE